MPDRTIEEIIRTLDDMNSVDDAALYLRVRNTIRKRSRRKRALLYAAIILPMVMAGGGILWYVGNSNDQNTIVRHEGIVRLVLPDGEVHTIDDGSADAPDKDKGIVFRNENGSLAFDNIYDDEAGICTIEVPKGAQFDFVLDDGTHVWLNADSRLSYPPRLARDERRVALCGEGYFEVARDTLRPFVVDSEGQQLMVLGTKFNLSAYAGERIIYTTLIEGSVSLREAGGHGELVLAPGIRAELDRDRGGFIQYPCNANDAAAWRNDVIVFNGHTLEQMMKKLARIYTIEYMFENESLKSLVTYGTMPVQDDIETILMLIEASGNVAFDIDGGRITIKAAP